MLRQRAGIERQPRDVPSDLHVDRLGRGQEMSRGVRAERAPEHRL